MITSKEMLKLLMDLSETFKKLESEKDIIIDFDKNTFIEIIDDVEHYINEHLNECVENGINCSKKAAAFELILRHRCPLKIQNSTEEDNIKLNSDFAMTFAIFILFEKSFFNVFSLNTLKGTNVDNPFQIAMENHNIWLQKLRFSGKKEVIIPVIINASFWTLASIIYHNQKDFIPT